MINIKLSMTGSGAVSEFAAGFLRSIAESRL